MPLSPSAQKVQDALAARGFALKIRELVQPTGSAAEAAAVLGRQVDQIAKSLVLRCADSDRVVLVIASGANRVDEAKVAVLHRPHRGAADGPPTAMPRAGRAPDESETSGLSTTYWVLKKRLESV